MTITPTTPVSEVTDRAHAEYIRRAAGLGRTSYDRAGLDANGRDANGVDWTDWVTPEAPAGNTCLGCRLPEADCICGTL